MLKAIHAKKKAKFEYFRYKRKDKLTMNSKKENTRTNKNNCNTKTGLNPLKLLWKL